MTDEKNQIKFFLYENWARTKTGQHTVEDMRYVLLHTFHYKELFTENGSIDVDFTSYLLLSC